MSFRDTVSLNGKIALLSLSLICSVSSPARAETLHGDGRYWMRDEESMTEAREKAYKRALQDITEQAGVYVASRSRMENLLLAEDDIIFISSAIVSVKSRDFSTSANSQGRLEVSASVEADVDTEKAGELLISLAAAHEAGTGYGKTEAASPADATPLKPPDETAPPVVPSASERNEAPLNYLDLVDYMVTAERIPTRRLDTPANVTVITSEEIEENHYQDVGEALSHVNGVIMTLDSVRLNGSDKVVVLLDGQRLDNDEGILDRYSVDFHIIPSMKMIDRIEIVKGGSSALYGSDAIGGVVNIITKKGTKNETEIDLNTGSWNRNSYEIMNQGKKGNLSWFVTGGLMRSRAYEYKGQKGDVLSAASDYYDTAFSARADNSFDDRSSLTLRLLHRGHEYYSRRIEERYDNVALTYNFKEGTSSRGWLRYFNNSKSIDMISGDADMRMQGLDYQNGWELGPHRLIAGMELKRSKASYQDRGFTGKVVNNQAYYLQDKVRLGEKWTFVPGIRLDHNDKFGNNWSPKAAVNYRPDESTKLYVSWGRVYKAPMTAQMYDNYTGLTTINGSYDYLSYYGNPNLRPERGYTATLGFEHDFDESSSLSMSLFSTTVKNLFDWSPTTTYYPTVGIYRTIQRAVNTDEETYRGIEAAFRRRVDDHWSYGLGYSHIRVRNSGDMGVSYSQPNGYRLGLRYRNGPLRASLLGVFATGLDDNVFASKRYAVMDFNLSYDVTERSVVYFKARNFTNQNYSPNGKDDFEPGRSIQTGFIYRF